MIPITSYTKSMYRIHTHILGTSLLREEYDAYTVVYHIYTKRERESESVWNEPYYVEREMCWLYIIARTAFDDGTEKKPATEKKNKRQQQQQQMPEHTKKTHTFIWEKNSLNHIARSFHLSSDSAMHIVRQCLCSLYQMYARSNT